MRAPLALLAVSVLLAGCFHADDVVPAETKNETGNKSAILGIQPPSIVTDETNATVNGTGGKPHIHDYWNGRSRVQILSQNVFSDVLPVFPLGEGSTQVMSARVEMPPGVLVYEGTGQVELLISQLAPTLTGVKVSIKTAMDFEFRQPVALVPDTPLVLDIRPEEADMPHATNSLWEFEFLADGTSPVFFGLGSPAEPLGASFNLSVTVVKAREVDNWPGHPDFYGSKTARLVLDRDATTRTVGVNDAWVYGASANNVPAERLISMGTHHLVVFVNVTSASSPAGEPSGYLLEYRNATGDWRRNYDVPNSTNLQQAFVVPVTPEGLDSPYAQQSRWMFRLIAVFATLPDNPVANGLCPGCFPYEVNYHITVVAYPAGDPEAGATG